MIPATRHIGPLWSAGFSRTGSQRFTKNQSAMFRVSSLQMSCSWKTIRRAWQSMPYATVVKLAGRQELVCPIIHAGVEAHGVQAPCRNNVAASWFSATKAFGLGHFAWSFARVSQVIQRTRGLGMSAQPRKSGKISTKTFWTSSGIASVDPPCAQVVAASSSFTCQQVWARTKRRAHRGKIIGQGPGPSHGNKLMQPFSDKTKGCRHS